MKTYFIIGASSDIGMAYIDRLNKTSKPGETQVIAHYRTMSDQLSSLKKNAKNISLSTLQADLSSPQQVDELINSVKTDFSAPTHILHLAAGQFHHMRLRQFNRAITENELQIQVLSFAEILKAFIPDMAKKRYGKIVAVLTAYTFGIPPKFVTDYIICKYALSGLIKAAAAEYCDKGICINGLSPSLIDTKFLNNIDSRISEIEADNSPLKRNISINEVLAGIDFLFSDDNSYMCGTNINLSGGGR